MASHSLSSASAAKCRKEPALSTCMSDRRRRFLERHRAAVLASLESQEQIVPCRHRKLNVDGVAEVAWAMTMRLAIWPAEIDEIGMFEAFCWYKY